MPTGAFNICCPRDVVSRTANVERTGRHKWVKMDVSVPVLLKNAGNLTEISFETPGARLLYENILKSISLTWTYVIAWNINV